MSGRNLGFRNSLLRNVFVCVLCVVNMPQERHCVGVNLQFSLKITDYHRRFIPLEALYPF